MSKNYQFGVGEWTMRNGGTAWVKFEIPEPNETNYPLFGYYLEGKDYVSATWTKDGEYRRHDEHPLDLMPSRREVWMLEYAIVGGIKFPGAAYGRLKEAEIQHRSPYNASTGIVHFVELRPGEKIVRESKVSDE